MNQSKLVLQLTEIPRKPNQSRLQIVEMHKEAFGKEQTRPLSKADQAPVVDSSGMTSPPMD